MDPLQAGRGKGENKKNGEQHNKLLLAELKHLRMNDRRILSRLGGFRKYDKPIKATFFFVFLSRILGISSSGEKARRV